jgi:hypothetical protein
VSAVVTVVGGELSAHIGVAAYDANGQLISGARIASVAVGDWGNNVISVTSKVPIAKVVFTGDYLILDQLTFDTAKPSIAQGSQGKDRLDSKADGITRPRTSSSPAMATTRSSPRAATTRSKAPAEGQAARQWRRYALRRYRQGQALGDEGRTRSCSATSMPST